MRDDMVGAVMAGGQSARIGRPKAELEFDGRSFLEIVTSALASVFEEVVVCGGGPAPDGFELVPDRVPDAGPIAGLDAALRFADGRPAFVVAVDMPLVTTGTVGRLASRPLREEQARLARVDGRVQPLFGCYGPALAPMVRSVAMSDARAMMTLLRAVPHLTLVDVRDGSLANVNTQADYDALLRSQA